VRAPFRLALLAAAAGLLVGAGPKTKPAPLPAYTQAYEPRTVDERGLWMETDEVERRLRDSTLVIRDEPLNAYVHRVLCNTVGTDRCKSVRIYVMEVPQFNATMAPNGMMQIWSGLLLRVRNEAELAAVLGHEFAHFELRHSLKGFKQKRTASDIMAWATVLGAAAGADMSLLQLTLVGSTFRYGRDQEEEADLLALKYLAASPYPASAGAEVWENLMAEQDATAKGRRQKAVQRYSAGFFDSHPTELKRAVSMRSIASKLGDEGERQAAGHRLAMAGHLPRFLDAQLKLNDFGGSEYLLGELSKVDGSSGELLFARGELHRQRGNPRDLVSAAQFYSEALAKGYTRPETHRNLGLALLRSGKAAEAKASLMEYLKLQPDASDAKAINALLPN
jgi:predicted Zn-dependent protease